MNPPRLSYLSFDSVPAPKGAAVHIEAFVKILATAFGSVQLVTVSPTTEVVSNPIASEGVEQVAFPAIGETLIHRVMHWRSYLRQWLQGRHFQVIHFRSIYEGFPIASEKSRYCDRLIFEVNGLPSIELKYRYPDVASDRDLLDKLIAQENCCLQAADRIVTPSPVTRDYLLTRGVDPALIQVIPNGVDPALFTPQLPRRNREMESPGTSIQYPFRLLYFGTLSVWQGVDLAIRALAIVQSHFPAQLTVIGTATKRQRQAVRSLAGKLGVSQRLILREPMAQAELVEVLHNSDAVLAPLTLNDRNLVQGCCPLKVLEGMASGTPVITSDLPVVRHLGQPGRHFLAVKPGSVQAIADAVVHLHQEPELGLRLSQAARQQILEQFTWQQSGEALIWIYEDLGISRSRTV